MFRIMRLFLVFLIPVFGLLLVSGPASALQPLAEAEMQEITGQYGFSEFVVTENDTIAQMRLNIEGEIYAEIDHFGANFDEMDSTIADQDWYGVRLGEGDDEGEIGVQNNLNFREFFLEAVFENELGTANNRLLSLRMGFNDVSGRISADRLRFDGFAGGFDQFSGYYGPTTSRQQHYRDNLGAGYFTFNGDRSHMVLDARGMYESGYKDPLPAGFNPGVYMDFGNAEFDTY